MTLRERFYAKTRLGPRSRRLGTRCVDWTGGVSGGGGYGQISVGGRARGAHRMAWQLERGRIPRGQQLDHLCRRPICVNVAHLELVTSRENSRRGDHPTWRAWRRGTCCRGHRMTPQNRYANGRCRRCDHARKRGGLRPLAWRAPDRRSLAA